MRGNDMGAGYVAGANDERSLCVKNLTLGGCGQESHRASMNGHRLIVKTAAVYSNLPLTGARKRNLPAGAP